MPKNRRHPGLRVVNLRHHGIGRHRKNRAGLQQHTISPCGGIPQTRKAKERLISQEDIERLLATLAYLPLIKASDRENAVLAALLGPTVAGGGGHGLNPRIDGTELWRDTLRPKWHQAPAQQLTQAFAITFAHHRHTLSWGDVVAFKWGWWAAQTPRPLHGSI
jgi:hypothetical protein